MDKTPAAEEREHPHAHSWTRMRAPTWATGASRQEEQASQPGPNTTTRMNLVVPYVHKHRLHTTGPLVSCTTCPAFFLTGEDRFPSPEGHTGLNELPHQ